MLVFNGKNTGKKYRSKPDLIEAILTACIDKPLGKTKIMYTAYLSSEQTREYVTELVAKGLLSHDEEENTYLTTAPGKEYLRLYEKMKRLGAGGGNSS